jgi:SGNH domain (fused to AT3 domains)
VLRLAASTAAMCVVLAAIACAATGTASHHLRFAPTAHSDPADVAGGPLDLDSVTFGQAGTQLLLRLHSRSVWGAGELTHRFGRELCLTIFYHRDDEPQTRICVVKRAGKAALSYAHVDASGRDRHTKILAAQISRPDDHTLSAAFTPLAAELPFGQIAWKAESVWTNPEGQPCPPEDPCVDEVPDANPVIDQISLLSEPRCFGAASRDPHHHCRNPLLRHAVVPTPNNALITPNAYCKIVQNFGNVNVCAFGATPGEAKLTFALIGDSHSEHWRGAMEVVAQAREWRGLSISHSGCPFSAAPLRGVDRERQSTCRRWNRNVLNWLDRHPQVSTVFVSAHALARFQGSAEAGYRAAWARLPHSVKQIIVLRDPPETAEPKTGCINLAIAQHALAGVRCAGARRKDVKHDPEAAAAYESHSKRLRVIDLTHYMCSRRLCFAVVGGALVHKDNTHMTSTFSTTLGPYVLRTANRLIPAG